MYKKISALIAVILISLSCLCVSAENAAALSLSGPKNFSAGEEIEIEVTLGGKDLVSAAGQINYDAKKLEFVEASSNLARWSLETNTQDGTLYFSAANVTAKEVINKKTALFTVTFKASGDLGNESVNVSAENIKASAGGGTLSLANAQYSANNGTDIPNNGNSGSVESVDTAETENGPSNNNRLASLTVKGVELTPEFDPEEKKYTATVPFETEKLEVEAVPADEKATVTISDTELKYIGKNITKVQVVSESGLKRTYKIYTTRSAQAKKPSNSKPGSAGLQWWAIAIIAFAAAAVTAVIIILIIKKRKKKS